MVANEILGFPSPCRVYLEVGNVSKLLYDAQELTHKAVYDFMIS